MIAEQLDAFAAEGRVSSVTLIKVGGVWQAYVNLAAGVTSAQRKPTPMEALGAALAALPGLEAYELKYGVTGVNARAAAEAPASEPEGIFD